MNNVNVDKFISDDDGIEILYTPTDEESQQAKKEFEEAEKAKEEQESE